MLEQIGTEDERWRILIGQFPQATIFHSPEWINLIAKTYHYRSFILAEIDPLGHLLAGIPIIEKQSWSGQNSWVSLPFTDHCSPIAITDEQEFLFTKNLFEQVHQQPHLKLELRWPCKESGEFQSRQDHVLHTINLSSDFSHAAELIHPMHSRNARNAATHGVKIKIGDGDTYLDEFYRLHLITRRRLGVPIQPKIFFTNLAKNLLESAHGYIMCAYYDEICIAAAVFLLWNKTITYKFGASDPAYLKLRPNDLIFWNAIKWGCDNGYDFLDLGRTDVDNAGLRSYKSRWGASEMAINYCYAPTLPLHRSDWLLNILNMTIRHSPQWVCRLSGELLYRFAG
jgi:hypothetical protein